MVTLQEVDEMKLLLDGYLNGKISLDDYLSRLRQLAYGDPAVWESLIEQLRRLLAGKTPKRTKASP